MRGLNPLSKADKPKDRKRAAEGNLLPPGQGGGFWERKYQAGPRTPTLATWQPVEPMAAEQHMY